LKAFIKKNTKLILLSVLLSLLIALLMGLIITATSKYLENEQAQRDNSTKCKSYRALAKIAAAYYENDPDGGDWVSKSNEASLRQKQYKCTEYF
jgi:predicted transcriptional regulator